MAGYSQNSVFKALVGASNWVFCAPSICLGGGRTTVTLQLKKSSLLLLKKILRSLVVFEFGLTFSESIQFAQIVILFHFLKSTGCYHLVCTCMNECIYVSFFQRNWLFKLFLLFLFSILNFKELNFFNLLSLFAF